MRDHHYSSGSGLNNIKNGLGKVNLFMQWITLPNFCALRIQTKIEEDQTKMKNKVEKVRKRLYIDPGTVLSLNHMFYVRKGLNDIRMVYNGTSCGLNLALWAPHFGLPIVQHTLRALLPGYSQCDMDVG